MVIKEFKKFSSGIIEEYKEKIDKTQAMFDAGESDLSKYDLSTLNRRSGNVDAFSGETPESIIELCQQFIEERNEHLLLAQAVENYYVSAYDDGDYEEEMYYYYYVPKVFSISQAEGQIMNEFIEILRPKTVIGSRRRRPTTELMGLYKAGELSFEKLQSITHSLGEV